VKEASMAWLITQGVSRYVVSIIPCTMLPKKEHANPIPHHERKRK